MQQEEVDHLEQPDQLGRLAVREHRGQLELPEPQVEPETQVQQALPVRPVQLEPQGQREPMELQVQLVRLATLEQLEQVELKETQVRRDHRGQLDLPEHLAPPAYRVQQEALDPLVQLEPKVQVDPLGLQVQ